MENKEHPLFSGQGLEMIFERQKEVMTIGYGLGLVPFHPVSINAMKGQEVLRAYLGYGIQEMVEAFEAYEKILEAHLGNGEDKLKMKAVADFNEEMADVLHFFLEVLVFCDITIDDIKTYFEERLEKENLKEAFWFDKNLLKSLFCYCKSWNIHELKLPPRKNYYHYLPNTKDFKYAGGRMLSIEVLNTYAEEFWYVTKDFYKTFNLLKQKPWVQTNRPTDIMVFKEELLGSFVKLLAFFELVGFDEITIYENYCYKNDIVLKRFKENY